MTLVLVLVSLLAACGGSGFEADDAALLEGDGKADSLSSTSTYYVGRPDLRRCASPMCGGTWVRRVNFKATRCVDGTWQSECYVWSVDLAALQLDDYLASLASTGFSDGSVVLRGKLALVGQNKFATFVGSEAWLSAAGPAPAAVDAFYRATDAGIRCITTPCPSVHLAKLNSTLATNRASVDLAKVPGSDADRQADQDDLYGKPGLLVAGSLTGGANPTLHASQAYRRVRNGGACGQAGDGACGPGLLCCFPCGIQPNPDLGHDACHDRCMPPQNGTDHCPLFQ